MAELIVAGISGNKIIPDANSKIITLMYPTYSPADGSSTSCFDASLGTVYSVPVGKKLILLNYSFYIPSTGGGTQVLFYRGSTVNSIVGGTVMMVHRGEAAAQDQNHASDIAIEVPAADYVTVNLNGSGSSTFAGCTMVGVEIDA
jgi:hypothetical protein